MFSIAEDQTIHLTRGDVATLEVMTNTSNNEPYIFKANDVVRFKVFEKKQCESVVFCKDVVVDNETTTVDVQLDKGDTKFGNYINKPVEYWYEIEVNPDTYPQTIIGYDSRGPKVLRLYPEGGDPDEH